MRMNGRHLRLSVARRGESSGHPAIARQALIAVMELIDTLC